MLIWPRVVCGSTMYHLAHLVVHVFPSCLGTAIWWQCGSPPGFSVQCEVEMLCTGWRCGGVKFCLFLVVFTVRCISSVSPRFYFRKHAFCFLPLATTLESPRHCLQDLDSSQWIQSHWAFSLRINFGLNWHLTSVENLKRW
jgi:hypothetical protein